MELIKLFHRLYDLKDSIPWIDYGREAPFFQYYYAEERLYAIHDKQLKNISLVKAGSPGEALNKFRKLLEGEADR